MLGLAGYLIGWMLQSAWAPRALPDQLQKAAQQEHLPIAALVRTAPRIALLAHSQQTWSMAFYLPHPPRVVLYAPYYFRGLELTDVGSMRLDVAEYYFHALLLATLDDLEQGQGTYAAFLRKRLPTLMAEVPPEYRREAYLDALASFGSHALSVAHEISRKAVAWRSRGRSLCPRGKTQLPLFRLWERIFDDEEYRGAYSLPGETRTRYSRAPLETADKAAFVDEVFAGKWQGAAVDDFRFLCEENKAQGLSGSRPYELARLARRCEGVGFPAAMMRHGDC